MQMQPPPRPPPSSSLIIGDRMGKYVTRYAVTVKERTNYTPQLLNNYIPPAAANNTLVGYLFIEKKGNMTIDPFPQHITFRHHCWRFFDLKSCCIINVFCRANYSYSSFTPTCCTRCRRRPIKGKAEAVQWTLQSIGIPAPFLFTIHVTRFYIWSAKASLLSGLRHPDHHLRVPLYGYLSKCLVPAE